VLDRHDGKLDMRALERLCAAAIPEQTRWALKTFVGATDLYGQIYVVRDSVSRMKAPRRSAGI
jgi:hypothetical protein